VAAADAAVDADRASIQAQTLREAAAEAFQVACAGHAPMHVIEPGEAEWFWAHELGKDDAFDYPSRAAYRWLRARADRIEGKP
jgi:catechol-2,3-dioxygenase